MTRWEIYEAIAAIENKVARGKTSDLSVCLGRHRWEQVLRILKFYRIRWDVLELDPILDGDQSDPASPYFHKGQSAEYLAEAHRVFMRDRVEG